MHVLARPLARIHADRRLWRLALDWIARCAARHRSRQDLRALCPHLRRDLGLTEGAVAREASKPCWRM
ncbi:MULTISPECIES: DUF1127 domain-containing protein [Roseomonadaceae]|uniref:DUF1127 domain-containing protein n=1 Tax=Falsiroseomonas oleicola TaxID=2801474 RepID=A0ABS6H4Q6_9PROT|nr:DUF1127 domain-containing protein [Roseomonas oleicola]MBU8542486.1 DUF1127 domain-containing protein [Roseomonas oleicola]